MDCSLTRRAIEVNWLNLALGHEVFSVDAATFVRNAALPDVYDANFVFDVTASEPAEIARLLSRAAREFAYAPRLTFRLDPFTPPAFEARLVFDGFERSENIVLILDGPLRGVARRFEIRSIEDQAAWLAYRELRYLNWREYAGGKNGDPDDVGIAQRLASANELKCPPVEYLLAYEGGRAVGHCSMWEGREGVGQVEDVFVHPAYRRRGIGVAIIHRAVERARAHGARPMVIVVDSANEPAKKLYAALGWRPIGLCRQYGRNNDR
jgi:ribosomal protein S18 acetylase RimI-like enzyme